jgi:hypothetical protein
MYQRLEDTMIWGKRAFSSIEDFGQYQERLIKHLYQNPTRYREFIMVRAKTEDPASKIYYVGVPAETFTESFAGFEYVRDEELPKVIDAVIVADVNSEEFTSRFNYSSLSIVTDAVHFLDGP